MILTQGLSMVRPWLFGMASDILIRSRQQHWTTEATMSRIILISAAIWVSSLCSNGLGLLRGIIETKKLDFQMDRYIQQRTLQRLMEFSPGQHMAENSGLKQSVVNKGQHALSTLAYAVVYEVAPVLLECTILISVLAWLSWRVGLVVIIGCTAFLTVTSLINKPFVPKLKKYEKMWHDNSRHYHEVIRNLPLVQYNAQEERIVQECDQSMEKVGAYAQSIWVGYQTRTSLRNGIIIGGASAAIIATAAYAVVTGTCSPGQFITLVWWSFSPIGRIEALSAVQRRILTMRTSIEKYWNMLAMEPDVNDTPTALSPDDIRGKIEFSHVSFSYPKRKSMPTSDENEEAAEPRYQELQESISDVSFLISPGERIAVVGPSGAGKSTLIKLLMRSSDNFEGHIRLDGYEIRQLAKQRLRRAVGIVEQDVTLWDTTLRANITFGLTRHQRNQITDQELDRICRLCRIDQFMHRMEHGYETIIGERGIQLSGGQRQRVGIARAIIKNPAILILDEATNNLDAESEQLISKALDEVSRNRTTIIVAHRFSTIRSADRILVMDDGRLVDMGRHEELAQRCDVYQRLLRNQLGNAAA